MNVLFFMRHPGHLRNYESTLFELARRGHRVHVAFDREKEGLPGQRSLVDSFAGTEEVTFGAAPVPTKAEEWTLVACQLRAMLDYLRYLEPPLDRAPLLRSRAARAVPPPFVRGLDALRSRDRVRRSLSALERAVAPRRSTLTFIAERSPDLVLVTPLLDFGSPQLDYLRASKRLGIPTCFCVASWDNLTNKGLLHELPTRLTVWNEAQRREAVELHAVPAERIAVTGAQAYDRWFGRRPTKDRDELLRAAGLAEERPYVLYVGSSPFLAPHEGEWIARWLRALRDVAPHASVLVRPHPLNDLSAADASALLQTDGVSVWPREAQNPVDDQTRADYFDSMFHASAVVGLNTSAMIEAAIVGRPVFTARSSPDGTIHFGYLLAENGGPAAAASSLGEHARQVARALDEETGPGAPATPFVRRFVRPLGLHEPATPLLVDALEEAAGRAAERLAQVPLAATAARPLLALGGAVGLRIRRRNTRRDVPDSQLSFLR
jgi:hypothetical protein